MTRAELHRAELASESLARLPDIPAPPLVEGCDAEAMERLRRWAEGDDDALNTENPDAR